MFALIVRDIQKRKPKARGKKPIEKLFQVYKNIGTVDKKAYEILMSEENIIDSYLEKSKMIKIVLGSEGAINLLSPAHFLCPFTNCDKRDKPILLRSFNNMSSVEDHLLGHDIYDSEGPAGVLLKPYQCLSKTDFLQENASLSAAKASDKLDVLGYEGKCTHSNKLGTLRLPTVSDSFCGKHLHTKLNILMKIINHEDDPLQGVPDKPKNPFEAAKRKRSFIAEAEEVTERQNVKVLKIIEVPKTVENIDFRKDKC